MIGYIVLAAIGALAFGGLVLLRLPRLLWTTAGAALFLGAAGYAWQGQPGLSAAQATPIQVAVAIDPAAIALREQMIGRFNADTAYLIASDAMLRSGSPRAAARVAIGGIRAIPQSFILWSQLGTNLALLDNDEMSTAAKLAFQRAMQLAPLHPAPPYYAGLAFVRAGDLPTARRLWSRAVALSPERASYKRNIAKQLRRLDQFIAMERRTGQ
ncbi:tetratricopeptide repeat protein [Sphingomonas radiodurans]|uniref:hypothetical protein n=1 Tax=Sphingomonas radiodurans TaxID=2890321 RepID=UPI001E64A451|nr:hypothetical protein [Sphingomonas radiodurans]WBH16298.1 hypothetical protein LLW23_16080 [Sphingomonas radiodurans]